jgi:hypothetical protein
MRCIKNDLIQKYIDGETSPKEVVLIEKHIEICEKCTAKVDEQRKLSSVIKKAINLLSEKTAGIPVFIMPVEGNKKRYFTVRKLVYVVSAACILLFISIISLKKEPENHTEIILIEPVFAPEFDANLPVSQQQIVITIIDSKGNRTEYFE